MRVRWTFQRCLVRFASTQRRAQNLSERYQILENTARVKSGLKQPNELVPTRTTAPPDTFAGFVIPKEPRAPGDDECCMSGCAVCVYDVYEDALAAYKESVAALRAELAARDIPEPEWPAHVRIRKGREAGAGVVERTRGEVVLDAFEEMERALKEKQARRAAVEAETSAWEQRAPGLGLRDVYEGIKWVVFPNR